MILNRIWIGFFLVAFIVGTCKLVFYSDLLIYERMITALFDSAKAGFEICIGLTGALCFWLGFMRIGEKGGAVQILSKLIAPLFSRIFPEIPKDHPAVGSIMMNFSANMLGLDNSATPLGLKAMKEMQELNPQKDTASNAQIMFLALNTAGLTIIPVSVLALRAQSDNVQNPTEVFIPILITTFFSAFAAMIIVALRQKIRLVDPVIIAYMLGGLGFVGGLMMSTIWFPQYASIISSVVGNGLLILIIMLFLGLAIKRKVVVYEEFIEGAKEGFEIAIRIVPYVIAILTAMALFKASGSLDAMTDGIKQFFLAVGLTHTEFVDALPVGFMKPFSGSGARAILQDILTSNQGGRFVEKCASTMQGGTETTFYVLAVYFGSVRITKTRYAAGVGILVDLIGIIVAILVSYLFYKID